MYIDGFLKYIYTVKDLYFHVNLPEAIFSLFDKNTCLIFFLCLHNENNAFVAITMVKGMNKIKNKISLWNTEIKIGTLIDITIFQSCCIHNFKCIS